MKAELIRKYGEKETLGELKVDGFSCKTLELPWKNNEHNVSCIPAGTYTVVKRPAHEKRPYNHFHVTNVPNRNWILIHTGNKYTDILGCILVGDSYGDINKDGVPDVLNSAKTLKALYEVMPDKFELTIK